MKITEPRIVVAAVIIFLSGSWFHGQHVRKAALGYPATVSSLESKEIYRVTGIVKFSPEEPVVVILRVGDKTNNIRFFQLENSDNLKRGRLYQWDGSEMKLLSTVEVVTNYVPIVAQPELGLPTK
ncbi:MAG: hypothetical protein WCT19_00135 [Candidatus Paceibacterota bacterium]